jgi:tetratricopeptide (TPR) repeat protein
LILPLSLAQELRRSAMYPMHFLYVLVLTSCSLSSLGDEFGDLIAKGKKDLDAFRYADAARAFERAIALEPKNPKSYYYRSVALFNRARFDDALKDINTCIFLDKEFPSAFRLRGQIYFGKNDYAHSISDFTEAIRIDSKDVDAFGGRASAFEEKGDYANAIKDYTKVMELSPKTGQGHVWLGTLYATCPEAKFRDGKKALELAKQACEITDWKDHFCLETLAAAYAELCEFEEAVKWQKKVLDDDSLPDVLRTKAKDRLQLYKDQKPFRRK